VTKEGMPPTTHYQEIQCKIQHGGSILFFMHLDPPWLILLLISWVVGRVASNSRAVLASLYIPGVSVATAITHRVRH